MSVHSALTRSIPGELETIARVHSAALVSETGGRVRFLEAYTNMLLWLSAMREGR